MSASASHHRPRRVRASATLRTYPRTVASGEVRRGSLTSVTDAIDREILRSAMLESLRREPPQQFINFQHHVGRVLAERRLPVDGAHGDYVVRRLDERRFREILWDLINAGILVQGLNSSNPQWPWLSLTERGEDYVRSGGPDIYNPDGYMRTLEKDGELDEIERRYLSQAA